MFDPPIPEYVKVPEDLDWGVPQKQETSEMDWAKIFAEIQGQLHGGNVVNAVDKLLAFAQDVIARKPLQAVEDGFAAATDAEQAAQAIVGTDTFKSAVSDHVQATLEAQKPTPPTT